MPAFTLPEDRGSLVNNVEGGPSQNSGTNDAGAFAVRSIGAPDDDSAAIPRGLAATKPGHFANRGPSLETPLEPVSIPSTVMDGPKNPQLWNSGDKGTDWMGGDSFISGTRGMTGLKGPVPPIPTPSNKRPYKPGSGR